jgi:hypothetical protein
LLRRGAGLVTEKWQAAAGGILPVVGTPPPRGIEGALAGRVLRMWNVETPSRSGHDEVAGGPTVRRAELPGGNRMAQEANVGRPKGDGKAGTRSDLRRPLA